ncbi:hypothetical protein K7A41_01545 [Sphingobacterium sp. InxBP1]|uniref:hypothetical protein n=1 Tax=Sphingobacterium sp. InxBP1 TaxID=2870328 RepID=UPI002244C830|nr:hypothetical protein [Sphingobacterium sp. InxBP1]MCW8309900.1 hypothetical protein [Sphingobacterium sp. InxBP1]
MIRKFIKKNIKPLEGVELTQLNRKQVLEWLSGNGKEGPDGSIFLKTPESGEGTQIVHTGKFILKGYTEQLGWHFWPVDESYMAENYDEYPVKVVRNVQV